MIESPATRQRREREIQHAVMTYLRARGILCWPQQRERAGYRRASHIGFKGLPDIGGVLPGGRAIQVEIKRPGEKPTPYQLGAMEMLAKQGALVFVAKSLEDAVMQLPPDVGPARGGR